MLAHLLCIILCVATVSCMGSRSLLGAADPDALQIGMVVMGTTQTDWDDNPTGYATAFQNSVWYVFDKSGLHPTWTSSAVIQSVTPSVQGAGGFDSTMILFTIKASGVLAMKDSILQEMRSTTPLSSTSKSWLQSWDDQIRAAAQVNGANIPGFIRGRCTSVVDTSLWVPTATPTPAPTSSMTGPDYLYLAMPIIGCTEAEWLANPEGYAAAFQFGLWYAFNKNGGTPGSALATKNIIGIAPSAHGSALSQVMVRFAIDYPDIAAKKAAIMTEINSPTVMVSTSKTFLLTMQGQIQNQAANPNSNIQHFVRARTLPVVDPALWPTPTAAPSASPPSGKNSGSSAAERTRNISLIAGFSVLLLAGGLFLYYRNKQPGTGTGTSSARKFEAVRNRDIMALKDPQVVNPLQAKGQWFGEVDEDKLPVGKGKFKYDNGQEYDGEMVKGARCGSGTCKYENGNTYFGNWDEDMWHGQGILRNADQEVLNVGNFEYGKFQSDPSMPATACWC